ncbi:MAG TPA: hypothetical protein VM865_09205 [Acidobacteriaceae bacterium]|jgi:hypothetical protein|nr:hypothetical protein [Acidobacteriaceae bacterium]
MDLSMELIEGRALSQEQFSIDDKHFRDCTLTGCVLEYSGGPYVLERTRLKGCSYVFFGPARGTVEFLQSVGLVTNEFSDWAELSDEVH